MKLQTKHLLTVGLLLFLFVSGGVAFASSSQYFTQAQKFINQNCNKKILADPTALLCYLFDKSQEQDISITNINQTISPIPSQIASLSATVKNIPIAQEWNIAGTYKLQFYDTNGGSPDGETITITSFGSTTSPTTTQFFGTGTHGTDTLTVFGDISGSQIDLVSFVPGGIRYNIKGSIAPDGSLWGVGTGHDGHGFVMTTLQGVATHKN